MTTARVLRQLRHDRRTIELVIVLPCLLLSIVAWMFSGTPTLDHWGPMLVGLAAQVDPCPWSNMPTREVERRRVAPDISP